jgi:hypothetical protein
MGTERSHGAGGRKGLASRSGRVRCGHRFLPPGGAAAAGWRGAQPPGGGRRPGDRTGHRRRRSARGGRTAARLGCGSGVSRWGSGGGVPRWPSAESCCACGPPGSWAPATPGRFVSATPNRSSTRGPMRSSATRAMRVRWPCGRVTRCRGGACRHWSRSARCSSPTSAGSRPRRRCSTGYREAATAGTGSEPGG